MKLFNRIVSALLTPVIASAISIAPLESIGFSNTKVNAQLLLKYSSEENTTNIDISYFVDKLVLLNKQRDEKYLKLARDVIDEWDVMTRNKELRDLPGSQSLHVAIFWHSEAVKEIEFNQKHSDFLVEPYSIDNLIKHANENTEKYLSKTTENITISNFCKATIDFTRELTALKMYDVCRKYY